MAELGAAEKPVLTVLNKIDRVVEPMRRRALLEAYPGAVAISAATGLGLEDLLHKFMEHLAERVRRCRYRIPQHRGDVVALLHSDAKVLATSYEGNDVVMEALVNDAVEGRVRDFREVGAARS
jgi:GTP-binding protein HflX